MCMRNRDYAHELDGTSASAWTFIGKDRRMLYMCVPVLRHKGLVMFYYSMYPHGPQCQCAEYHSVPVWCIYYTQASLPLLADIMTAVFLDNFDLSTHLCLDAYSAYSLITMAEGTYDIKHPNDL